MKIIHKLGQSMLEYTLLLAVIIAIIIGTLVKNDGLLRKSVEKAYNKSAEALGSAAENITAQVFR